MSETLAEPEIDSETDTQTGTRRALTLALQGEVFAIDAGTVREILDMPPVTQVPNASPFANGLINVRGRVVPLVDLRVTFGMERRPPDEDTRIIVIETLLEGEENILGILADKGAAGGKIGGVLEVRNIDEDIYIPLTTLSKRFKWEPDDAELSQITVQVKDADRLQEALDRNLWTPRSNSARARVASMT